MIAAVSGSRFLLLAVGLALLPQATRPVVSERLRLARVVGARTCALLVRRDRPATEGRLELVDGERTLLFVELAVEGALLRGDGRARVHVLETPLCGYDLGLEALAQGEERLLVLEPFELTAPATGTAEPAEIFRVGALGRAVGRLRTRGEAREVGLDPAFDLGSLRPRPASAEDAELRWYELDGLRALLPELAAKNERIAVPPTMECKSQEVQVPVVDGRPAALALYAESWADLVPPPGRRDNLVAAFLSDGVVFFRQDRERGNAPWSRGRVTSERVRALARELGRLVEVDRKLDRSWWGPHGSPENLVVATGGVVLSLQLDPTTSYSPEVEEFHSFLRVWKEARASLLAALPASGDPIAEPRIEYRRVH